MVEYKIVECDSGDYRDMLDGTYACPKCGFVNRTKQGIVAHMVSHQDLHLRCPECYREFRNKRGLGRHIGSSHTEHEQVECDVCGERFRNKRALGNHKAESHEYLVSRTCEICGRECSGWVSYQNHVKFAHEGVEQGHHGGGKGRGPNPRASKTFSVMKRIWWLTATDDEKRLLSESSHTEEAQRKRYAGAIRTWGEKTVDDLAEIHRKVIDGKTRYKCSIENKGGEEVGCDSLFEAGLCEAMLLDDSVSDFTRCSDVIPMIGMRATYNPDFRVELCNGNIVVIEVKGRLGWSGEELRRLPFKAESAASFYGEMGVAYRILFASDVGDYRESLGLSRRADVDATPISDNR